MAFRFDIHETVLKGIPRIARERIDRVIESLSEKPQPSAESIHDARKNLKCLRALLRLARGSIERDFRRRENFFFRDIGRSLSAARDPHALLEALEYFRKHRQNNSRSAGPKQELTSAFIKKLQEKIEHEIVHELPPGAAKKIAGDLREAKRRVDHWFDGAMLHPENEWENFVGVGLRRTYRQGKRVVWQFEAAGKEAANDETWHELRKCAKALGYQLRLFRPAWPEMMNQLVDEIDRLTDRLGDANDLAILRRKILSEPYDPSEKQSSAETRRAFLRSLDRRKHKLRQEAFNLARLIYTDKPGQFERRLGRYWQIWNSQNNRKEAAANAGINTEVESQRLNDRNVSQQLADARKI
jgi:CHAD domain-containing protein